MSNMKKQPSQKSAPFELKLKLKPLPLMEPENGDNTKCENIQETSISEDESSIQAENSVESWKVT